MQVGDDHPAVAPRRHRPWRGDARPGRPFRRLVPRALLTLVALLLLTACSDGPVREWRDLELTLPDGWMVFEDSPTGFSIADGELGEEAGDRGEREAAAFLTYEPATVPDDWRAFVVDVGGELETDQAIEVGGLPATQLIFSHASNGVPLREMVVLVPSRGIVMLMQPLVVQGQTDGPEEFTAHLPEFQALVDSIEFGAPVDPAGTANGRLR